MIRFYPKPMPPSMDSEGVEGYSLTDIRTGQMWLYADVTCEHCGKEQPVAATHYLGGPCVRCKRPTVGNSED